MMLSDAQVERYSRQILLPEVGGRGQALLLGARVAVAGRGPAAAHAVTMLGRAGVGLLDVERGLPPLPELAPDCRVAPWDARLETPADVVVDLGLDAAGTNALGRSTAVAGRPLVRGMVGAEAEIVVVTLVGRPCFACCGTEVLPEPAEPSGGLAAPAALALGALAASEALCVLLALRKHGLRTHCRLADGEAHAARLGQAEPCTLCAAGT
jgi:adenylyltransferase/sulfurtransferase